MYFTNFPAINTFVIINIFHYQYNLDGKTYIPHHRRPKRWGFRSKVNMHSPRTHKLRLFYFSI